MIDFTRRHEEQVETIRQNRQGDQGIVSGDSMFGGVWGRSRAVARPRDFSYQFVCSRASRAR